MKPEGKMKETKESRRLHHFATGCRRRWRLCSAGRLKRRGLDEGMEYGEQDGGSANLPRAHCSNSTNANEMYPTVGKGNPNLQSQTRRRLVLRLAEVSLIRPERVREDAERGLQEAKAKDRRQR